MRTNESWIAEAREHSDKLRSLVRNWHPVNLASRNARGQSQPKSPGPITAVASEAACAVAREQIVRHSEGDPVADLDEALKQSNVSRINQLLSDAWFGVPESRNCWDIVGFKQAVDLMDDPPDTEDGL